MSWVLYHFQFYFVYFFYFSGYVILVRSWFLRSIFILNYYSLSNSFHFALIPNTYFDLAFVVFMLIFSLTLRGRGGDGAGNEDDIKCILREHNISCECAKRSRQALLESPLASLLLLTVSWNCWWPTYRYRSALETSCGTHPPSLLFFILWLPSCGVLDLDSGGFAVVRPPALASGLHRFPCSRHNPELAAVASTPVCVRVFINGRRD